MTPEQLAEARRQHLQRMLVQRAAAQQAAVAAHKAAQARKQAMLSGLAALGGAALGYGALRLLKSETARHKAGELLTKIGDRCANEVERQLEGLITNTGSAPQAGQYLFHPQQQQQEPPAKDVEFRVLDE